MEEEKVAERITKLLQSFPFLSIPRHFGLIRGTDDDEVVYRTEDGNRLLKSIQEVHSFLREKDLPLSMSFFSFDPNVQPKLMFVKPYWSTMTFKPDLSEGQERIPIPVIWSDPDPTSKWRLAKYVAENFLDKDLEGKVNLKHEDGFFVCCDCEDDCQDKLKCACFLRTRDNCSAKTRRSVGDANIGYTYNRLERPFLSGIFECNHLCQCKKSTCVNRVVQNGIICHLQLFMTGMKGWGVRVLCDVPQGTFLCTYAGKIVTEEYANEVSTNWHAGKWKYLSELRPGEEGKEGYEEEVVEPEPHVKEEIKEEFSEESLLKADLVSQEEWEVLCENASLNVIYQPMSVSDWEEFMKEEEDSVKQEVEEEEIPLVSCKRINSKAKKPRKKRTTRKAKAKPETGPYVNEEHPLVTYNLNVDGYHCGNIGRYFNHSCDPNVFPQCVFVDSHDLRHPRIAFFAARTLRAGEELTWDYKYEPEDLSARAVPGTPASSSSGIGSLDDSNDNDIKVDPNERYLLKKRVKKSEYAEVTATLLQQEISAVLEPESYSPIPSVLFPFPSTVKENDFQPMFIKCRCGMDNCKKKVC